MSAPSIDSKFYGLRYIHSYQMQVKNAHMKDQSLSDQLMLVQLFIKHQDLYKSQLGQDIFALAMSNFKNNGYFVEVGAHHSEHLSNTWLLENQYYWDGLLVECNPKNHLNLESRKAKLVKQAAWHTSGEVLEFHATIDSALATLADANHKDAHDRSQFDTISVETMTMDDILENNGAPRTIDYISIDVEGAELEVLQGLTPDKWNINIINLEHNHDQDKIARYDIKMKEFGLIRAFEAVSDFDSYYVKPNTLEDFRKNFSI